MSEQSETSATDAAVQSRNPNDQHLPATHGREGAGVPATSVSADAGTGRKPAAKKRAAKKSSK